MIWDDEPGDFAKRRFWDLFPLMLGVVLLGIFLWFVSTFQACAARDEAINMGFIAGQKSCVDFKGASRSLVIELANKGLSKHFEAAKSSFRLGYEGCKEIG